MRCDLKSCPEPIVVVFVPHPADVFPSYGLCAEHLRRHRSEYHADLFDVVMALATPGKPIELPRPRLTTA